jgi:glycosyltransferase involved in cell wall biosynthesis
MKERIAIFLDTKKNSGGAYEELLYMIEKIDKINKNELDIVIISTSKEVTQVFKKRNFESHYFSMNTLERYLSFLRNHGSLVRRIKKYFFFKNKLESFLKKIKIDLVYFTGPSPYSLYLEDIDFIITVPDVSHREEIEFPEWAKSAEFERLDEILRKSTIKAVAVITNAEIIKERISFFYSVLKERIYVINHQPSQSISKFSNIDTTSSEKVKKLYKLPERYIFYPAMYLPHKNHKYVIDVITLIKSEYKIELHAVFCGSDKGYLKKIKKYAYDKKANENIIFLDFVEGEHLPYLYLNSLALVMPTLSGPTNIPPWEAFKMNIPVFYSDIHNIRKVYKDAVYYVDPFNPKTMAAGIKNLIQDKNLRNKLIENGKEVFNSIDVNKEFKQFFEIIKKRRKVKETWELNN